MAFQDAGKIRAITWQVTITVAGMAVVIWLVYALRLILLLLALTVLFAYLLRPLVDGVEAPARRWGAYRGWRRMMRRWRRRRWTI